LDFFVQLCVLRGLVVVVAVLGGPLDRLRLSFKLDRVNIVLIGLRGTGKTVCGKLLSRRLRWSFVDTDEVIQERSGMNIREIFAEEG